MSTPEAQPNQGGQAPPFAEAIKQFELSIQDAMRVAIQGGVPLEALPKLLFGHAMDAHSLYVGVMIQSAMENGLSKFAEYADKKYQPKTGIVVP